MKNDAIVEKIKCNMMKGETPLSSFACPSNKGIRLKAEENDIRTSFFRDADRIIYSLSYTRCIDKTQVFSLNDNDNISKRIVHVQFVSKIARTIGRALNLNEDLIEAASSGHDLGHVPFGHVGEAILNKISLKCGEGYFNHNIQSVRNLMVLENNGEGRNLCVQTLDAIMCHNGEFLEGKYEPKEKSVEDFLNEYNASYHDKEIIKTLKPMTLEGCVVRISDITAYLGHDIEDAIRLGIITKGEIPPKIVKILGNTNRSIINNIILDIIMNSLDKNYIMLSKDVYNAINDLKKFNYKHIYAKANTKAEISLYEMMYNHLFEVYSNQIKNKKTNEKIFTSYLNQMSQEYLDNTSDNRKVIDYIAGMTDNYFQKEFNRYRYKK